MLVMEISDNIGMMEDVKAPELSRGFESVAEVQAENDLLAEQVNALQTVIYDGAPVAAMDIVFIVEMLERQLLKLDYIDVEGEGKGWRKMEVCRVQGLLDTTNNLKKVNSCRDNNTTDVSVRTNCESSEPDVRTPDAQTSSPSSKMVNQNQEVVENSDGKEMMEDVKMPEISKGSEAVAEVQAEDDLLAEKVDALQTVIYAGAKVAGKDIHWIVEMLEKQLLKLDNIVAEGEGKVQRKMEVYRVQGLLDRADNLKDRNSCPDSNITNTVSVQTNCQTLEADVETPNAQPSSPFIKAQRSFFRAIEKEGQVSLQMESVIINSKWLLVENSDGEEMMEEVRTPEISRGSMAVAEIRVEDDKLAEQVDALKTVVYDGAKVAERDTNFILEMLEQQLLKLDNVKAEGEGKVQRKMEVSLVQSLLDTADNLKKRNSCQDSNASNVVSVSMNGATSEADVETPKSQSSTPSTAVNQDSEVLE